MAGKQFQPPQHRALESTVPKTAARFKVCATDILLLTSNRKAKKKRALTGPVRGCNVHWLEWFANLSVQQNPLEDFLQHRLQGPTPEGFGLVGQGQEWRICMTSKFSGDATAAGWVTTLWKQLIYFVETRRVKLVSHPPLQWAKCERGLGCFSNAVILSPPLPAFQKARPSGIRCSQFHPSGRLLFLQTGGATRKDRVRRPRDGLKICFFLRDCCQFEEKRKVK